LTVVSSKSTDDRGQYRLFWLVPGEYYVGANPPRLSAASSARAFHPSAVDVRTAASLSLTDGVDLERIDIPIPKGNTFKVSGRDLFDGACVERQPGVLPPQLYLVTADSNAILDDSSFAFANMAADQTGGRFELRGVMPGSYDLVVVGRDSQGRTLPVRQ